MKFVLTLLALPLVLASAPAMAQDCTKRGCSSAAQPTQADAADEMPPALARELAIRKMMVKASASDTMDAHVGHDREPCGHDEQCRHAEGLCRDCPKVARAAECIDCPDEDPASANPA